MLNLYHCNNVPIISRHIEIEIELYSIGWHFISITYTTLDGSELMICNFYLHYLGLFLAWAIGSTLPQGVPKIPRLRALRQDQTHLRPVSVDKA